MARRSLLALSVAVGCVLLAAVAVSAQTAQPTLTVTHPVSFAISQPLSHVSPAASSAAPASSQAPRVIPLRPRPLTGRGALVPAPALQDGALQTTAGRLLELEDEGGKPRFPGIGANGSAPSDANIAVGPNHIVQMVNSEIAVYSKSGNLLAGYPKSLGSIFSSLGGSCTGEWGDPIVQYDRAADRWLLTQLESFNGPYGECIAVSQTNDPTGAYFLYAFSTGSDYVWPLKRSCKRLLTTMVRAFQITWIAKDVRATFRINSWSMAETGNHAVGTVTLSSVLCRLVVAAITARVASTSTAYRHWPCQPGGVRLHTVAKAGREDVLVYSLNRLMLCEAAQAERCDVHKHRPPLGDQLSPTWGSPC